MMAAGLMLALGATSAAAQTRFAWPDTTVDVAKYTVIEQCLAAADRIRGGLFWQNDRIVWRDTMPADVQGALRPDPAPVTEAAVRCAARFPEPTANLHDFAPLLRLYLVAGRDADAKALVERRLAAVPAAATRERAAVSDSAVDIYLRAQPRRLDAAEQLLVTRARGAGDRLDRLELYARLVDAAQNAGDTARARRAATWAVAVADSLTATERESERFDQLEPDPSPGVPPRGGNLVVLNAMQAIVGLRTLLDSLRHSTAAMIDLERSLWARFTKERPEAFPLPIGEKAPTIAADYWFPREASTTPHPRPGHVSIIKFIDTSVPSGCLGGGRVVTDACVFPLTLLRRLSDRFPELDITIVAGTHGSFLYVPPPSPAAEAELIRNWLEPYRSRMHEGAIAVSSRPFWNLPQPDGRRVDKPTPNAVAYSFGKSWVAEGSAVGGMYLVDQDGIIVDVSSNEGATFQFIDVLLKRQREGGDHAAK